MLNTAPVTSPESVESSDTLLFESKGFQSNIWVGTSSVKTIEQNTKRSLTVTSEENNDSFTHTISAFDTTGIMLLVAEIFALRARVKELESQAHNHE